MMKVKNIWLTEYLEDNENTNNFNFSLYIKSYTQFNDISENKILKILHIYMKISLCRI